MITEEELRREYIDNEKTQQECADFFGYSKRSIASYMKTYGIEGRTERNEKWSSRISEKLKGNKNGEGVVCTSEKREKIRKALQDKYSEDPKSHPMYGKTQSDNMKSIMREKMTGRVFSDETRQKMSDSKKTEHHKNIAITNLANYYASEAYKNSSLEELGYTKLAESDIAFIPQYRIGDYIVDAYIPKLKVVVEFLGNYWHTKKDNLERDERKREFLSEEGYRLVEVWEQDIDTWNPKSIME